MKRLLLVMVFCLIAVSADFSEASSAKKLAKSILNGIKSATTSLVNVFVDTEATAQTSPTKLNNSMIVILDMNDRQMAKTVSLETAGGLVTVGIKD